MYQPKTNFARTGAVSTSSGQVPGQGGANGRIGSYTEHRTADVERDGRLVAGDVRELKSLFRSSSRINGQRAMVVRSVGRTGKASWHSWLRSVTHYRPVIRQRLQPR